MSHCSGKYVIKGMASKDIWSKNKDSILDTVELKYDPQGEVYLGEDEMGLEPNNHYDKYTCDVDVWENPDDDNIGENSYSEAVCRNGDGADVELQFSWDDDCFGVSRIIFDEMIERIEKYCKLDNSAKWVWVSDLDTFRGGGRSVSESGMNMGTIG
jgi:hypothetical protein